MKLGKKRNIFILGIFVIIMSILLVGCIPKQLEVDKLKEIEVEEVLVNETTRRNISQIINNHEINETEFNECIEIEGIKRNYNRGEVVLRFNKNISLLEAKEFTGSLGLGWEVAYHWQTDYLNLALINVPNGKEIIFVCKLKQYNEVIKDSFLNTIGEVVS